MMFTTTTPPGREALADELEELVRREVERDRVGVERVDHDHVPLLLMARQPLPPVVGVDGEPGTARELEPAIRGVDDLRIELDHLQPQLREVAPHPLRRRAPAEADEEHVLRRRAVREPEVEVVRVEEPRSVRVGQPHPALERVVEPEVARVVVVGDDQPVVLRVPRLADVEAVAPSSPIDGGIERPGRAVLALAVERRPVLRRDALQLLRVRRARARRARTTAPASAPVRTTAAGTRRTASATISAAATRVTAPTASTWSVPSSGTSQNAVTNVPKMLPAVEIEKRRPAVRPSRSSELAASLTAIGEAEARTMLAGPEEDRGGEQRVEPRPRIPVDDPRQHGLVDHGHERDEHRTEGQRPR